MKDYAAIYNNTADSSALEQQWFLALETAKGVLAVPTDSDFLFALSGGSLEYAQPFEVSPHRSGRHQNNIIKQKKTMSWSLSTFFNIDTTLGAAADAEVDTAIRVLWESLLGRKFTNGASGPSFDTKNAPSISFSLFSNGDKFAQQGSGCFVQDCTANFPGDGQATLEFSGIGKEALTIGIGKTTISNNGGSTITLEAGDGRQMKVGGLVMLVLADGSTRSADTPNGTALIVSDITGDVVTVTDIAGAPVVLADADGSAGDVFLVYYEAENPVGIDDPQVGLVGSITVGTHTLSCVRSLSVAMTNNHEPIDYCFGEDSLHGELFVSGDRFTATVTTQLNMSKATIGLFRDIEEFGTQAINVILGDSAGRFFELNMPKVIFPVPVVTIPESGSIPVDFSDGIALQTSLNAADELTAGYK